MSGRWNDDRLPAPVPASGCSLLDTTGEHFAERFAAMSDAHPGQVVRVEFFEHYDRRGVAVGCPDSVDPGTRASRSASGHGTASVTAPGNPPGSLDGPLPVGATGDPTLLPAQVPSGPEAHQGRVPASRVTSWSPAQGTTSPGFVLGLLAVLIVVGCVLVGGVA